MKVFQRIILLLSLVILLAPLIQQSSGLISSSPLKGFFQLHDYPSLTAQSWFSGEFQRDISIACNDRIGFRSDFVRIFNQVDFSLFSLPHAEKIIVGKRGYLMAQQYLDATMGLDYVGEALIKEKVKMFVNIQDELWRQKRQLLVLVFPPDKGTFYPEFIPDRYLTNNQPETNYLAYREELKLNDANFIDFNDYFLKLKDSSQYVLYPKTGIHWSTYGALLAADSLSRFLESKMAIELPRMITDSMVVTDALRSPDGDMGETMNLIWEIPHPGMAYPVIHFDTTPERKKINALVIGDSFYWNWYYSGYIKNTFRDEAFWYYNKEVYPENFSNPTTVWDIDREKVFANADVIIILLVNAGYGNIGYGILEELATYLGMEDPRVTEITARMRNSAEWMEALRDKASERNIPLEEMMRIDARYMLDQQLKEQN